MIAEWITEAFELGMFQHRGEIEPFARWIMDDVQPKRILEIGSWRGGSTLLFGRMASRQIVSVDLPGGQFGGENLGSTSCSDRNQKLCGLLGKKYSGILANSHLPQALSAARDSLDADADLLFIDGDHSYRGVRQDWEWFRWLVRPGGWVAFHDILDTPWHRETGCEVDRLWRELQGEKREWCINGQWGGIGAVRV